MTLNKLVSGKLFKLLTHAFWVIMGCCCAWINASEPLVGWHL